MEASTIINTILCVLSFILAGISVWTVYTSIQQNHRIMEQNQKMIENSTRAYVVATLKIATIKKQRSYLVIKNYGCSGATIDNLSFDIDLNKYAFNDSIHPFLHSKNTFIAPNQKYMSVIDGEKLTREGIKTINVTIQYHDSIQTYTETYPINYKGYIENIIEREKIQGGHEMQYMLNAVENLVEEQF